jgi:uncharacterized membrane protein (UPF0182 family)
MEPTLEDAMLALIRRSSGAAAAREVAAEIGLGPAAADGGEEAGARPAAGATTASLAAQAKTAYDRAVTAQRAGDWAAYGEALEELGRILEELSAQ